MAEQATLEGFNARALRVGVTGAFRTAPLGTPVPDGFDGTYDTDVYTNHGYLSPDGVAVNFDESTNEYIPWQEMVAIRRDLTQAVKSIQVTLWQFTKDNAELYFGVPGGTIVTNEDGSWYFDERGVPEFEHRQSIIDVLDGDRAAKLILLDAQVSERSGMTIQREEALGLQLTLTGYPGGIEYADQGLQGVTNRWLFSSSWDGSGATGPVNGGDDGTGGAEGN